MVRLPILILAFVALACQSDARSQEQSTTTPTSRTSAATAEPDRTNDAIYRSRRNAITQAVERATPAIVSVNVIEVQRVLVRDPISNFFNDPFWGRFYTERYTERQVRNLGSGFLISADGYIVTNYHVVDNAVKVTVSLASGATLDAVIVGRDQASDLALLKVNASEPLPHLSFASDTDPIVGEWAIALGNPFGLFEAAEPSVTVGVVSATNRDLGRQQNSLLYGMIQTDASINTGNSGGPLINALGEVIGVNTAIYSQTGGSVGLGFAVPTAKAQRVIEELRTHGKVDRAYYTGLAGEIVTEKIAYELELERATGIIIVGVEPGSPAQLAGFKPGDVITSLAGERIEGQNDYLARLYDFRPGDTVDVSVLRDGEHVDIELRIGRRDN